MWNKKREILSIQVLRIHLESEEFKKDVIELAEQPDRNLVFGLGRNLCVAHVQARIEIELTMNTIAQYVYKWTLQNSNESIKEWRLQKPI